MLNVLLSLLLQAAPAEGPIVLASADDCAVFAEVGKTKWATWPEESKARFFGDFDIAGGGIYRQQCDWEALGVPAPRPGDTESTSGFWFSKPVFSDNGQMATVDFTTAVKPSFYSMEHCRLEKRGGKWRLIACDQGPIT